MIACIRHNSTLVEYSADRSCPLCKTQAELAEALKELGKARDALSEIRKGNDLSTDYDAYLYDLATWGLGLSGETKERPRLKGYEVAA